MLRPEDGVELCVVVVDCVVKLVIVDDSELAKSKINALIVASDTTATTAFR